MAIRHIVLCLRVGTSFVLRYPHTLTAHLLRRSQVLGRSLCWVARIRGVISSSEPGHPHKGARSTRLRRVEVEPSCDRKRDCVLTAIRRRDRIKVCRVRASTSTREPSLSDSRRCSHETPMSAGVRRGPSSAGFSSRSLSELQERSCRERRNGSSARTRATSS